jgi:hypothetical protein
MDLEDKRTYGELITLYNLEPDLRDIYVEGNSDKLIIERFLIKNKIADFNIIEIDNINFQELYSEIPELRRNNKKKITILSCKLDELFSKSLDKVNCIADKDFDEFLNTLLSNNYLLYTDYTCFEMYLFNNDCISIFYKNILRGFPVTPSKTLRVLGEVLKEKYLIRLVIQLKGEINDENSITDISKSIKVNKKTGEISFDFKAHLLKILNNNKISSKLEDYIKGIEEQRLKCDNDFRNFIRGHDFIHLLYIFINKINNKISISELTLDRSLNQCIDYSELSKTNLFKTLLKIYK